MSSLSRADNILLIWSCNVLVWDNKGNPHTTVKNEILHYLLKNMDISSSITNRAHVTYSKLQRIQNHQSNQQLLFIVPSKE